MSLREHIARANLDVNIALLFMRACYLKPFYSVVIRRGKTYEMWANIDTKRKIISCARLEQMSLVEFVEWLRGRYSVAKILFPDPSVYEDKNVKVES